MVCCKCCNVKQTLLVWAHVRQFFLFTVALSSAHIKFHAPLCRSFVLCVKIRAYLSVGQKVGHRTKSKVDCSAKRVRQMNVEFRVCAPGLYESTRKISGEWYADHENLLTCSELIDDVYVLDPVSWFRLVNRHVIRFAWGNLYIAAETVILRTWTSPACTWRNWLKVLLWNDSS